MYFRGAWGYACFHVEIYPILVNRIFNFAFPVQCSSIQYRSSYLNSSSIDPSRKKFHEHVHRVFSNEFKTDNQSLINVQGKKICC